MEAPVERLLRPVISGLGGTKGFTFLAKARRLAASGRRVINFGIGQPDFKPPRHVIEAAVEALEEGFTGYTEAQGIPELREAIAEYLNSRYGAGVDASEVLVTPGAKTAIFMAMLAYLSPGDEVVIPEPSYYAYSQAAKAVGARPVFVPLRWRGAPEGFSLDASVIEEALTPRTRMIVITNPHNPTGAVFPRGEVEEVLELAEKRGLVVLADEIYDNFVYDGGFYSVLQHGGWKSNVVYVNGHSKTFAMTGFRLGYLVAERRVVEAMRRLAVNLYSCAPSISQRAGVAALRGPWEPVERMIEEFRARRDLVYEELRRVPGFETPKPRGAFYAFPRVARVLEEAGVDVDAFTDMLLDAKAVAVLPGTNFPDKAGAGFVRISFAVSRRDIAEGVRRIREYVEELLSSSKS